MQKKRDTALDIQGRAFRFQDYKEQAYLQLDEQKHTHCMESIHVYVYVDSDYGLN